MVVTSKHLATFILGAAAGVAMHKYLQTDEGEKLMEELKTKIAKPKLGKPKRFQVLLLNDDYTTMEFVVAVLMRFFSKDEEAANAIMIKIHVDGEGVCGTYSHDIANTKVTQVTDFARNNEQPLMCVLRELSD